MLAPSNKPIRIGIVAGEASGDILGAGLINAFRQLYPKATFEGIGGPLMKQAGCQCLFDASVLSHMGLIDPILNLRSILKTRRSLIAHFLNKKPDIFIGIDSPDFNLSVEKRLKKSGIKTMHYVGPSVWAWRKRRIHLIKKAVCRMLVLFPFETAIYDQHEIPVTCVGHPMADEYAVHWHPSSTVLARQNLGLALDKPTVAILPGSRRNEYKYLMPTFVQAARLIKEKMPDVQLVSPVIGEGAAYWQEALKNDRDLNLIICQDKAREVIEAADVVLLSSGTATLQTMLLKKPMVIAYKMAPFNYFVGKRLVDIPYIGLPNLLARERLMPEYLQEAATPEQLSSDVLAFFKEDNQRYIEKYISLHQDLARDANQVAAKALKEVIELE